MKNISMSAFGLNETHGIVSLPSCQISASSVELGWTSLLVSTQHEEPFEAAVDPVSDHLIVLHLGGPARVRGRVDGRNICKTVPPGGVFLWPAGSRFQIRLEQPVDTLHLYIRSSVVEDVAAALGYVQLDAACLVPRLGETDTLLEQLALEVRRAAASGGKSSMLYVDQLALAIAARLVRANMEPIRGEHLNVRGLTSVQLKRVEEYIEAYLDKAIDLDGLSRASSLSVSHFVRQFRVTTGVSPHQFVLRRRVERAKRMLQYSERAVAQIALDCGFSHQEHLTHTFKRFTGATPARYRRSVRN
jgi:AraC family transcriptional regulator